MNILTFYKNKYSLTISFINPHNINDLFNSINFINKLSTITYSLTYHLYIHKYYLI